MAARVKRGAGVAGALLALGMQGSCGLPGNGGAGVGPSDQPDAGGSDGATNADDGGSASDVALDMDASTTKTGCSGLVPLAYNANTDRLPHPATPPALGPAGSVVSDPVYGTKMLRLTDVNTVAGTNLSYRVANEFWGNDWNTDATLFYVQDSSGAFLLYSLQPSALTAARVEDMKAPGTPLKMPLQPGGFSRTEASVFYGLKSFGIAKFDFTTQTETDLVGLTTIVPGATGAALGVEQGANGLFATAFGGPEQDKMPYVATWDPATGTHHVVDVTQSTLDGTPIGMTIGGGVHSFKLDQSGRYLAFGVNGGAGPNDWLWDTTNQTVQPIASFGTVGSGAWVQKGNGDSYAWGLGTFASAGMTSPLVTPLLSPTDTLASSSLSWENAVPGALAPVIVETMRQPADMGPWRAWDEELIALRTDGTLSQVWRFAHNFNTYSGTVFSDAYYYLFIPRVSQNGWFAIIDSNWGGTLGTDATGNPRTDVFIVPLANDCGP